MDSSVMSRTSPHIPQIDWAKGLAILCVLLIHSKPISGTLLSDHFVNRAVPVFIVLFGMTSELWWRSHLEESTRERITAWYRARVLRLYIPIWGMLMVWWTLALTFDAKIAFSPVMFMLTAVGYVPWVGTGWFITLVLQIVVLFPVLRKLMAVSGSVPTLLVSVAITVAVSLHPLVIISWLRAGLGGVPGVHDFFYIWIFVPFYFSHVFAGILLARYGRSISVRTTGAAATILIVGIWAHDSVLSDALVRHALRSLLDIPLTVMLLGLIGFVRWLPSIADGLRWCGRASWGLYLGQMIVHNTVHLLVGAPEFLSISYRWAYFFALLVGSIGFIVIGDAVRSTLSRSLTRDVGATTATG